MVTHSYASTPACYDDPVFARTHFLARVASEDLGVSQMQQRHKLSSAKLNDLHAWDARWFFHSAQPSEDDDDNSSSGEESDTVAPRRVAATSRLQRARSSTTPGQQSSSSTSRLAYTPASKSRVAPLSEAVTKRHSNVRHDRSASAPEPRLLPPQPLSINTAQPLRLAQPDLCTLSPLAYPVGIFDAGASDSAASQEPATPSKRKVLSRTSSTVTSSPLASSSRSSTADVARPTVIECSESDGSCHNDAGDADPEGQLAAEIIRLRNARKLESVREASTSAAVGSAYAFQPKVDVELHVSTSDYSPEFDEEDSYSERSLVINGHASHPILRFAEAMLEFGTCSLERFTSAGDEDCIDAGASQSSSSPLAAPSPRRVSTTPKDLGREAQLMRLRRQETNSARSSRSNSVNSLSTWFRGPESSLSLRARGSRQANSLLSLPSLMGQSASEGSLDVSSTSTSSMPASPHLTSSPLASEAITSEEDAGDHAELSHSFAGLAASDRAAYPRYSYGLDGYSDAPSSFLAPSTSNMDVVFQSYAAKEHGSKPLDGTHEPEPSLWRGLFAA